jgi:site-specific recombinase XerD
MNCTPATLEFYRHTAGAFLSLVEAQGVTDPQEVAARYVRQYLAQLRQIVKACNVRDRALILFMVDSGLRRRETINLNWSDVDMTSGLLRVKEGKGKKDRSAVIGATTRRALLAYRRTLSTIADKSPLFQTREGGRFASDGFIQIFNRIKKRTGIHVTPHTRGGRLLSCPFAPG